MKRILANPTLVAFISIWLALFILCSVLSGIAYSVNPDTASPNQPNDSQTPANTTPAVTTPAPKPQTTDPAPKSPYEDLVYSADNAKTLIYLDAGHGWYDNGTSVKVNEEGILDENGEYVLEKTLTLEMTKKLKKALEKMGYTIGETRPGDNEADCPIPLVNGIFYAQDRPGYVNSKKADYFISLHCNSFSDASVNGTRIYYSPNFAQNPILASAVSTALTEAIGETIRLYSGNELAIPRESAMPTLLIESGFLTNQSDLDQLLDSHWQDQFVCAIAKGIDAYIHAEN